MTTLVIGAGLVGSQVARSLVDRGERPVLMDHAAQTAAIGQIVDLKNVVLTRGDILRPLSIVEVINEHKITRIVHTAANPLLTLGAQKDPYSAINLNIMGTVNVLEAARIGGIRRVVVSSSNVLNHYLAGGEGVGAGELMNEEAFPRPTTFYAATKQSIESLGLNYAKWCGVEFAAMRYGAVFGPWNGAGGGGPSNVVREAMRRALAGETAIVSASTMEWVYSRDAAHGTVLALHAEDLGSAVFNITMGSLTTSQDMATAITTAIPGARIEIATAAATAVSMQTMRRQSDQSKARTILGYMPQFELQAAVNDLAGWMKKHPS